MVWAVPRRLSVDVPRACHERDADAERLITLRTLSITGGGGAHLFRDVSEHAGGEHRQGAAARPGRLVFAMPPLRLVGKLPSALAVGVPRACRDRDAGAERLITLRTPSTPRDETRIFSP